MRLRREEGRLGSGKDRRKKKGEPQKHKADGLDILHMCGDLPLLGDYLRVQVYSTTRAVVSPV